MQYCSVNYSYSVRDHTVLMLCGRVAFTLFLFHGLSNRAILNDLDGPQTQISRSGHSLTLNICEMAADTAIVTMEGE